MAQKRLTLDEADFIMKLDEVGFSNSEIARKLGVTEGAIRYRIKRQASREPDGGRVSPRISIPSGSGSEPGSRIMRTAGAGRHFGSWSRC